MSYQKKSLILQEIEQAIRKKAQQKSRTKEQVGRVLQNSIEKKKNIMRSTAIKEQKVLSSQKNQNYQQSYKTMDKHVSLFNNEQLNTLEGDLKLKKYNNRRLDKLVSLIQYMVSSSEKVIKYISSTNFQAEFALKLYRSDKQNLLNQLKNLTIQDFIEAYKANEKVSAPKNDVNYNLLLEENTKLKKDVMILQKQAERYVKSSFQQKQPLQLKIVQRQVMKLKETVRKLIPFESFKKYIEILQKQTKFQSMEMKCQESSKKIAEIELVIASLQTERNSIIQNIIRVRGEPKSERTYKMNEIQGQKQQLQKQIGSLKSRISQMKQSSKLLEQYQMLKRNSEHVNEKLSSLANQLSDGNYNTSKRSSQILIDFIKIKTKDSTLFYRKKAQEAQSLLIERDQLQLLIKQKDQELANFHQRMENMHAQVENLRQNLQQSKKDKIQMQDKLRVSQSLIENRQSQILILNQKLKSNENKEESTNDIRMKNSQLRKQLQSLSKRNEEKQKWLKDKIHSLENEKQQVQDKLMQLQVFLSHKNEQIEQLIKEKQSRQDSTQVIIEKIKIASKKQVQQLQQTNEQLHSQLQNQTFKYQKLMQTYQQSNQYYKVLTQSYNQKHQRLKQLQEQIQQQQKTIQELQDLNKKISKSNQQTSDAFGRIKELQLQNKNLEIERERVRKQNQVVSQKLRITQQEIIKNSYSLEEFSNIKGQNVRLNEAISNSKRQLQQKNSQYNQSLVHLSSLEEKITSFSDIESQLKNEVLFSYEAKKELQNIIQQKSKSYQLQITSQSKKLHQNQLQLAKISLQKKELQEHLLIQRERNEHMSNKTRSLEREIEDLNSQMRSLTIISNQISKQKQHLIQSLSSLQEQTIKLKQQLQTTNQQIQDQSQITKSKTIQYVYLLRQILKGISIETSDYQHISSFEELLEFGAKEVVQMRKRLRQQESNRRRNYRKDQQYNFMDEGDSPRLQDLKTRLFQMGIQEVTNSQKYENFNQEGSRIPSENEKLQLNQFQDMASQRVNDSIISEDNKFNAEQFDDLKSQQMNASMVSNKQQDLQIQSRNLLDNLDTNQQNEQIGYSQMSQERQRLALDFNNEMKNQKQGVQEQANKDKFLLQMPYKPQIISEVAQLIDISSRISAIPYRQQAASAISAKSQSKVQQQVQNSKKSVEISKSSLKPGIDLKIQQYLQVNSDEQSIKSQKQIIKKQSKQKSEVQQYISKSNSSDVVIYSLQPRNLQSLLKFSDEQQQNASGADFDQFNEMNFGNNQSMISQKQQNLSSFAQLPAENPNNSYLSNKNSEAQDQLGLDQFGEVRNQPMNESMLSEKENQKQHGLSQFGDFKEEEANNQSMLSEKEHGLSDFGDFKEEEMNRSMLSQKEKSQEHGLSDFGELNQVNFGNESIMSEQQRSNSHANSEQNGVNNLDDFDEIKSDKMNDSILSEK